MQCRTPGPVCVAEDIARVLEATPAIGLGGHPGELSKLVHEVSLIVVTTPEGNRSPGERRGVVFQHDGALESQNAVQHLGVHAHFPAERLDQPAVTHSQLPGKPRYREVG